MADRQQPVNLAMHLQVAPWDSTGLLLWSILQHSLRSALLAHRRWQR